MGSGKNILELIPNSEILWLAQQGDFLVHFMDIAWDELSKKPDEISVEKLQVWLSYSISGLVYLALGSTNKLKVLVAGVTQGLLMWFSLFFCFLYFL